CPFVSRPLLAAAALTAAAFVFAAPAQATELDDSLDLAPRTTNATPAAADLPFPALPLTDLARPLSLQQTPPPPAPGGPVQPGRVRTYDLPAVTVSGARASDLREEDRVGTYGQPRWTATRRFPNTRVYV